CCPQCPSEEVSLYGRDVPRPSAQKPHPLTNTAAIHEKSPGMSRGFPRVRLALRSIRSEQVEAIVEPRGDLVRLQVGIRNEPVNSQRQHGRSEPELVGVKLGETVFH